MAIGTSCEVVVGGFDITDRTGSATRFLIDNIGNFGINGLSAGSGQGVIFIANMTTAPTSNPSSGGILYVEVGALKYRGSSGIYVPQPTEVFMKVAPTSPFL